MYGTLQCEMFHEKIELDTFFCMYCIQLLHSPPPLRFHCAGGRWDQTQDCCDFGIWQSHALTTRLDLIHLPWVGSAPQCCQSI
jgi:hypothetical protein